MALEHRDGYLIPCAILRLLPVLCLGSAVKAFGAKDADYSYYKTFHWLPSKMLTKAGVVEDDPTVAPRIAKSVKSQLAKKGLTEVAQGADLTRRHLGRWRNRFLKSRRSSLVLFQARIGDLPVHHHR